MNLVDPLGLYDTENCTRKQKKRVKNACEIATKKATNFGIGDQFQTMLDSATISCTPVPIYQDDCGGNDFSKTIYLSYLEHTCNGSRLKSVGLAFSAVLGSN